MTAIKMALIGAGVGAGALILYVGWNKYGKRDGNVIARYTEEVLSQPVGYNNILERPGVMDRLIITREERTARRSTINPLSGGSGTAGAERFGL